MARRSRGAPRSEGEQRLLVEWSWTVVDDEAPEDEDEETDDCILTRFAEDRATREPHARLAREWLASAHWGLWLLRDPSPAPGVWLVDLLTSARAYAAIPPEQLEGLAPWSVLFGQLVPVDGIWRTAGTFVALDPAKADRLALDIAHIVVRLVNELEGRKARTRFPEPYDGLPPSAAADLTPPTSRWTCAMFHKVVRVGVPQVHARLEAWDAAPPTLANTDGDPLIFLTAEIEITDRPALLERLRDHPDFDVRRDKVVWLGREMTASEAAMAEAEFETYAAREGIGGPLPEGPRRYTRGEITAKGRTLTVRMNSRERLQRLIEILQGAGARPTVRSQVAADPFEDLGLGISRAPAPAPETGRAGIDAWARAWVDESIPALGGLTPRQATKDEQGGVRLEALLRQFEHRAAVNRARGVEDVDVARLRADLGM